MYGGNRPQAGNPYGLEYKHYLGAIGASSTGTTLTSNQMELFLLNAPAQGSSSATRVGNEITMKRIQMNLYLWNLRGTTSASGNRMPNMVRVGFLLDTQPAGATAATPSTYPSDTLIFSTHLNPTPLLSALRNYLNTDRFKILKSKWVNLNGDIGVDGDNNSFQGQGFDKVVRLGCRLPNYKVTFSEGSQVIRSGSALYGFVISGHNINGNGATTESNVIYSGSSALTYVDS